MKFKDKKSDKSEVAFLNVHFTCRHLTKEIDLLFLSAVEWSNGEIEEGEE